MKRYKIAFAVLALLFIVGAMCIYPVSANVLSDCTTSYDESTQKVHVEVTLTGGEEGARASEYPRDFVILVDTSLSMRDVYKDKTRLDWAKNATIDFLESLHAYNSRVGVVSFSDDATEVCPLTFNFEGVKRGIENVSSHGFSTNYGEGIQKAALVLQRRERESLPIIILLADGGEDKGVTSVEDAVDFAKKEGIMIYAISFGDSEWIDEVMLREKMADQTGGEYGHASFEELSDALIEMMKMGEFLSAANLRISILQSSDAALDFYSIPSRPLATSGVIVTAKDSSSFVCPKLSKGEEIIIEFDAFSAKEGENITAGVVDVDYTSKGGKEEKVPVSAKCSIPPTPPWFLILAITVVILFGVLVTLLIMTKRWREEKGIAAEKSKESTEYKSRLNDNKAIIEKAIREIKEANDFMIHETGESEEIINRLEEATKMLKEVKNSD
jgi:Mg-chelatase subunit ChlD